MTEYERLSLRLQVLIATGISGLAAELVTSLAAGRGDVGTVALVLDYQRQLMAVTGDVSIALGGPVVPPPG